MKTWKHDCTKGSKQGTEADEAILTVELTTQLLTTKPFLLRNSFVITVTQKGLCYLQRIKKRSEFEVILTCPGRACRRTRPWPTSRSCPWSARKGSSRSRSSPRSGWEYRTGSCRSLAEYLMTSFSKSLLYLDSRRGCWDICPGWDLPSCSSPSYLWLEMEDGRSSYVVWDVASSSYVWTEMEEVVLSRRLFIQSSGDRFLVQSSFSLLLLQSVQTDSCSAVKQVAGNILSWCGASLAR